MRRITIALLAASAFVSTAVTAAPLDAKAKGRALYEKAIAFQTVTGKGVTPAMAAWLADEFKAAGIPASDIVIKPHDKEATLIVRWRAAAPKAKPVIVLAHMDVVEALRSDWSLDPWTLVEKDGYFYGRGAWDNKAGLIGSATALLQLKAEGFKPTRDIIILYTGDEEVGGDGARLASTEWRPLIDAEYALNSDAGGGGFTPGGKPLGFVLQSAEKTYMMFTLAATNKGGHSSKPRPDNAIYQLSAALGRLGGYRFAPSLNETTRAYFTERAKQEKGPLGDAMRRLIANPDDAAAADAIDQDEGELGIARTTCVATRLEGGHADNALPQTAVARVNCRVLPGVEVAAVQAELAKAVADPGVVVASAEEAHSAPASPLRPEIVAAYTKAVRAQFPGMPIIPEMSTGATDGAWLRQAGIPTYGVDGAWGVIPDDLRAHGRDERLPVKSFYGNITHWRSIITTLAGGK